MVSACPENQYPCHTWGWMTWRWHEGVTGLCPCSHLVHAFYCNSTYFLLWLCVLSVVTMHALSCGLRVFYREFFLLWPLMFSVVTLHAFCCDCVCFLVWPWLLSSVAVHAFYSDPICFLIYNPSFFPSSYLFVSFLLKVHPGAEL